MKNMLIADSLRHLFVRLGFAVVAATFVALVAPLFVQPAAAEKTLRVATYGLPPGLGNPHTSTNHPTIFTWMAFFDTITYVDAQGTTNPGLAVAWESKGTDTWLLTLRPGVKFQNGEAFNANAVVANLEYLLSEKGRTTSVFREIHGLASARAVDDLTVEIRTKIPNPILAAQLGTLRVFAPGHWADLGPEAFAKQPIGTGAFMATDWDVGKVEGVAFNNGWRSPKVDRLEIIELPENATRVAGVQSGQIDIALRISPDGKEAIESGGGTLLAVPVPSVTVMAIITTKEGPLQDVRVRRAINYGVNKEAYIAALFLGQTVPASQPADRATNGYQTGIAPYPYNPEKAKQLLAEAGYPDGFEFIVEFVASGVTADIYQYAAQNLAQIGVMMELRTMPISDLIGKIFKRTPWEGSAFGMDYGSGPSIDALRSLNSLHSCRFFNAWYCDEEIMPTIEAANQEFDLDKRAELVAQVMQRYHDQASALYFNESVEFDGLAKNVRNYERVQRVINYHAIDLVE